jgi:CTD small phosphatase-like protein 2
MHTPSPRKVSPILTHATENPPQIEKQFINLERLAQREEKLSILQDTLNNDLNIGSLCSDYWELSNDEALWNVEKLFKDNRTRKFMNDGLIVESLAIALMIFCSNHVSDRNNIANQLKNMVYFLHQNFLTIIDLILSKLPVSAASTTWVLSLKDTLKNKKVKTVKRSEHATYLKQHNEIISNCLRTIIRLLPIKSTPSLSMLLHILANRDKFSISVARSYVLQEPISADSSIIPPYLPEISDKEYTLVLDLDETLVHYSIQGTTGQLLIRPYCTEFLEEMFKHYELVVFTAGLQEVNVI